MTARRAVRLVFRNVYRADLHQSTAGSLAVKDELNWICHRPNALIREGEWFRLEIEANGRHLMTWINGELVADVSDATSRR